MWRLGNFSYKGYLIKRISRDSVLVYRVTRDFTIQDFATEKEAFEFIQSKFQ